MSYLRVQSNNPTNVSDTTKILKSTSVSRTTRRKSKPSWMTHKPVEQKFTARSSAHVKHNAGLNYRPPRHVGGFAPAGASKAEKEKSSLYFDAVTGEPSKDLINKKVVVKGVKGKILAIIAEKEEEEDGNSRAIKDLIDLETKRDLNETMKMNYLVKIKNTIGEKFDAYKKYILSKYRPSIDRYVFFKLVSEAEATTNKTLKPDGEQP